MPIERISGPDDPRIADYCAVPEAELVRARGLFVAEGRLVVRRLIEDGRYTIRSVLLNEAARIGLAAPLATLADRVPIYVGETDDFLGITGYNIHRGCLALVERPPARSPRDLIRAARVLVVLEGVTNADNVGGVFRNAAALGADAVLLSPTCCDPLYRKAIRTSMSATLRLSFAWLEPWPAALADLRAHGFTIAALTPREPAIPLEMFAADRPPRLALLVGGEGAGLSSAAESAADVRVRIPIDPAIDSLNLAVAAGIALYAIMTPQR